MQNIGGENAGDAFYRYKMPKLMAKIEGRGNGIKTNVVNNVDVAKALERPPEYLLKFYGCELGAQTNYDKATGTSIVNGAHDLRKLGELLEGFIKRYVQCYSCGNPETVMKVKKEFITLKCKACGAVSDVDMRHKLNTFILKNPPENKMSKEEKRLKKAEEERLRDARDGEKREKKKSSSSKDKDKEKGEKKEKKEKKDKKKKGDKGEGGEGGGEEGDEGASSTGKAPGEAGSDADGADESEGDDDEVVWMTDTSAEAVAARAAEQLTAATAAMVTQGNIEAELEKERKRAEKEARKQAEEAAAARRAAAAAALEAGDKVEPAVAADALRSILAEEGADSASLGAALKKLSVEGGLAGKARALIEAMFVDEPGVEDGPASALKLAAGVKRGAGFLRLLAADPPGQLALLVAVEWLCAAGAPARRQKEAALAVKALYDEDLVEEEIVLAWAARADAAKALGVDADGAQAVRRVVAPVVEWLEEGEGSSDEDEDEEDDDDEEDDEDEEEDDE